MNKEEYVEPMVSDKKGNLYVSMKLYRENMTSSENKLIKIVEYIKENYTNNNDLNDIWHPACKEIYKICIGDKQ